MGSGRLRTSHYKQCRRYAERDVQGIMGIQRHGTQPSLGMGRIIIKGSVKVRKGMLAIARLHGTLAGGIEEEDISVKG